ncbi:adenylate/guanylate cyclase domain-containing protein [Ruegeria arenilitoris]|uniref:adenylate/guanylate cyclase domain-containing protein n=1 Tax=Ruegeria arenilitoris TaxID=1173585 RepID=UPI00147E3FDF|nr:adenylate/guanylate cyclase domain-containing protein [Ruegeria arenilitoris]
MSKITPSPELAAVVRRWNLAVQNQDQAVLMNMLSKSEHLRYQGSADGECWSGTVFRDGFADHVREIPEFDWDEHSLEAFECGEVGWAHCSATLTFASNGNSTPHRFTFVLNLEDGIWKMVQLHVSNPMSNLEKIGVEHEALNALVEAARIGFQQDQSDGIASVMFTDIADSSELTRKLGDHEWADIISRHLELAEGIIVSHRGRLVKSLGDGTMSIFTSVQDSVDAAVNLQRRNASIDTAKILRLRIGIHTGEVIQKDEDFFGTVVNKAARVTDVSGPNEIHVSDVTRLMLDTDPNGRFGPPKPVLLKGFGGRQTVYSLNWK